MFTRYEYEVQGDWNPNIAAANCYANSKGNLYDHSNPYWILINL